MGWVCVQRAALAFDALFSPEAPSNTKSITTPTLVDAAAITWCNDYGDDDDRDHDMTVLSTCYF